MRVYSIQRRDPFGNSDKGFSNYDWSCESRAIEAKASRSRIQLFFPDSKSAGIGVGIDIPRSVATSVGGLLLAISGDSTLDVAMTLDES